MTKRVFISQLMAGKEPEEIKAVRAVIERRAEQDFGEVSFIESYIEDAPKHATPLWHLGASIQMLSGADVAYFAPGWQAARGCRIEHEACVEYGIDVVHA